MTVQSESATSPLIYQPEAWRDPTAHRLSQAQAFILVQISRGKRAQRVGGWPPNPCRLRAKPDIRTRSLFVP